MTSYSPTKVRDLLLRLSPYEFEQFVADVWEAQGWETTVRNQSRDRGIDVEAHRERPRRRYQAIQAKQYKPPNKVGSGEVRKYATLYQQDSSIDDVLIVTTSDFTSDAEELATDLSVKIYNYGRVFDLLSTLDLFYLLSEYEQEDEWIQPESAGDFLETIRLSYDLLVDELREGPYDSTTLGIIEVKTPMKLFIRYYFNAGSDVIIVMVRGVAGPSKIESLSTTVGRWGSKLYETEAEYGFRLGTEEDVPIRETLAHRTRQLVHSIDDCELGDLLLQAELREFPEGHMTRLQSTIP